LADEVFDWAQEVEEDRQLVLASQREVVRQAEDAANEHQRAVILLLAAGSLAGVTLVSRVVALGRARRSRVESARVVEVESDKRAGSTDAVGRTPGSVRRHTAADRRSALAGSRRMSGYAAPSALFSEKSGVEEGVRQDVEVR
jgi:hypothetical protein